MRELVSTFIGRLKYFLKEKTVYKIVKNVLCSILFIAVSNLFLIPLELSKISDPSQKRFVDYSFRKILQNLTGL